MKNKKIIFLLFLSALFIFNISNGQKKASKSQNPYIILEEALKGKDYMARCLAFNVVFDYNISQLIPLAKKQINNLNPFDVVKAVHKEAIPGFKQFLEKAVEVGMVYGATVFSAYLLSTLSDDSYKSFFKKKLGAIPWDEYPPNAIYNRGAVEICLGIGLFDQDLALYHMSNSIAQFEASAQLTSHYYSGDFIRSINEVISWFPDTIKIQLFSYINPLVRRMLPNLHTEERISALSFLMQTGDLKSLAEIKSYLEAASVNSDQKVNQDVIYAFAHIDTIDEAEYLIKLITHENPETRKSAFWGLNCLQTLSDEYLQILYSLVKSCKDIAVDPYKWSSIDERKQNDISENAIKLLIKHRYVPVLSILKTYISYPNNIAAYYSSYKGALIEVIKTITPQDRLLLEMFANADDPIKLLFNATAQFRSVGDLAREGLAYLGDREARNYFAEKLGNKKLSLWDKTELVRILIRSDQGKLNGK